VVANLLPGLREIRAPLISGYLWLAFLFLIFHEDLPTRAHSGQLQPLFSLADRLSAFGIATVSGVAAYLVGSAVQELIKLAGRLVSQERPLYGEAGTHLSDAGREDIRRYVGLRLQRVRGKLFQVAISPGEKGVDEEPGPLTIERELPLVRTLLLGERPELVREIDRLQAEADLRITVAFPLLFLAGFLAGEVALGWLAILPAALLLVAQGYQRQREAGDLLAKALRIGKADAPALESLEASADVVLDRIDLEEELDKKKDERHPMTEFRLGCLKANGEEFEAALVCLRFAAENDVVRAHSEIGDIYERRKEFDEAERAYRDGHARGDRKARQRLAALLSRLDRDEEALETVTLKEGEVGHEELGVEVPRKRNRETDYRRRTERGDAKAAINLGLLLRRRNDLAGAGSAFTKATNLDPMDAQAWVNLGFVEGEQGRFEEAVKAEERALELQEAQLGPDHLSVAMALGHLGVSVHSMGQYRRACELQERALAIREEHLGPDHFDVAVTLSNMGNALAGLGEFERSQKLLERSLAIKEKHQNPNQLSIAMTLSALGGLMHGLGRYERSQEILERALEIKEEQCGPEHFSVAIALGNLGRALLSRGRYEKARTFLERAITLAAEQLGEDNLYLADILRDHGELLEKDGDLGKALERYEQAVTITEKRAGTDHFFVASMLSAVGDVLRQIGDLPKSEKALRRALEISENADERNVPDLALILRALGKTLRARGSFGEARERIERAIKIQEESLGPGHPELAITLDAEADVLDDFGEEAAAQRTRERARRIRRENGIG
jgi:tetratricopeptide (TPR) repeat protein